MIEIEISIFQEKGPIFSLKLELAFEFCENNESVLAKTYIFRMVKKCSKKGCERFFLFCSKKELSVNEKTSCEKQPKIVEFQPQNAKKNEPLIFLENAHTLL